MEKKKIIQVIFCRDSNELLQLRLKYNKIVDLFIIFIESSFEIDLQNSASPFKIIVTGKHEDESEYYNFCFEELYKEIKKLNLNYEDIFLLSDEDEFTDLDFISEFEEEVKFNGFFLKHHQFWWGKNFFLNKPKLGTYVFNLSFYLRQKNAVEKFWISKKNTTNINPYEVNGWKFNHFYSKPSDYEFYFENLLPYNSLSEKLNSFEHELKLPDFYNSLPQIQSPKPKRILISTTHLDEFDESQFDKFCIINFEDLSQEIRVTDNKKIFIFNCPLPNRVLYGDNDYDNFLIDFKNHEIEKIKNLIRVTSEDIFEIKNPS